MKGFFKILKAFFTNKLAMRRSGKIPTMKAGFCRTEFSPAKGTVFMVAVRAYHIPRIRFLVIFQVRINGNFLKCFAE